MLLSLATALAKAHFAVRVKLIHRKTIIYQYWVQIFIAYLGSHVKQVSYWIKTKNSGPSRRGT